MAYSERTPIYRQIEHARQSKVIAYVTGDRVGLETAMASDVVDFFVHHLDKIGVVDKISLVLYTRGGETLSAWTIANLLRTFCDRFEVIVPSRCHSAGTLVCLAADNIMMTKQATLGPIDPSVNTPLNPQVPGGHPAARVPVNVEDVNSFLEHAREHLAHQPVDRVFEKLSEGVHPLVLGNAFRARSQIRMLGERLLSNHMSDKTSINKALDFLCSESGSHDYTINRREARQELGLPIETPSSEFYETLKVLYDIISLELKLTEPLNINTLSVMLGNSDQVACTFTRGFIESVAGGSHAFLTEGTLTRRQGQDEFGQISQGVGFQPDFEGWRMDNA